MHPCPDLSKSLRFVNSGLRIHHVSSLRFNWAVDIKQVRRLNLEMLITADETIERLVKGTTLVANYLSQIRIGHRNMGHKTARDIEMAKKLPPGWMDTMRFANPENAMDALELVQIAGSIAEVDKQALLKHARLLLKNQPPSNANPYPDAPKPPKKGGGTQ